MPTSSSGLQPGSNPSLRFQIDEDQNALETSAVATDQDWEIVFAIIVERGIRCLRTRHMTNSAMAHLPRLRSVKALDVSGPDLGDDGLLYLAGMPELEELTVSGKFTDRGCIAFRYMPHLRRFASCWLQTVTDEGLANLASCEALESVDLMGTTTGDGVLRALRGKPRLHNLKTGRQVTDAGLALLQDFPAFRKWREREISYDLMTFAPETSSVLLDGPFTDRGLKELTGLEGLFGLGFFWHAQGFTGAGLAPLAGLPNLGFLGCQGERCDDDAMRSIAVFPRLRMLMAQGAVAGDEGFAALSTSPTLEYLWGRECPNLSGPGFRSLAAMSALRGLGVSCKAVDEESLAALPTFPSLEQFMPMDVADEGFLHVGACAGLKDLWCMYCRGTGDRATEHLAGLKLRSYYAGRTQITDASCELLSRMQSLESIELWETANVTDGGLLALARLPHLRRITLNGLPRISSRGIGAFADPVHVSWG